MGKKRIITIGRQFGSNGRNIGKLIAEKLGVQCYDKELLQIAAKNSGVCEELLQNLDEKPNKSFLYSVVMDPYAFAYNFNNNNYTTNINQQAFQATFDTIRDLAERESCVIVGRCSDYILRERDDVLNVFIYAPLEARIKTVSERYPALTENKIKDQITKEDKARASYYNYYSSKKWGKMESYHLSIDSSILTIDKVADMIIEVFNNA
ncbi:MAG: cytidylate kinase-like family protein, partial [Eubacterium sp.]|nr:cytidylate kinase-like family protein [Eubacterium sp.]